MRLRRGPAPGLHLRRALRLRAPLRLRERLRLRPGKVTDRGACPRARPPANRVLAPRFDQIDIPGAR